MIQPEQTGDIRSELEKRDTAANSGPGARIKLPSDSDAGGSSVCEPTPPKKLTAEEQMALYEKELKEGDWGHQPC
jgi:hypothetical protein